MSKAYIGAGIGIIIIAAGAYYAFGRTGAMSEPAMQQASSTPSTLRELASAQVPQECTFTSANDSKGTVYVAAGRVRGDFSAEVSGKAIMGHLIVMDDTSYVWMDGMATGFKNSFEATTTAQANSSGMSPDEYVSYSCKPWSPDQNVFTLPAGITFNSMTDMQAKAAAGAVGAQCGQCAQIPDAAAKKQCLAALHC